MSEAPVQEGEVLAGKYRVDRVLGAGGMGVVVAATDLQLERRVAVKFLLPEYATHPEAAPRFLREARAAVKIQSEHVARVIDVGTLPTGAPFMVMEYLEGEDLAARVAGGGTVPAEEAVGYVLQACEAMAEAHAAGIIHRDLKPANLFLARQADGSSKVKVLDFGISKAAAEQAKGSQSLTKTSSMMGSPLYMSPEQMQSARDVDLRTDIWALGVILYELLTGNPPFDAESVPQLCALILQAQPIPPAAQRPDLPPGLDAVVMRCLEKRPQDRFATVAELAVALLPFAPEGAQGSVDRISRVLGATVPLSAPVPHGAGPHGAASQPGLAPTAPAMTGGSWGRTEVPRRGGRSWVLGAAGVGGLALVGLVTVGILRSSTGGGAEASAGGAASAAEAGAMPAETQAAAVPTTAAPDPAGEPADEESEGTADGGGAGPERPSEAPPVASGRRAPVPRRAPAAATPPAAASKPRGAASADRARAPETSSSDRFGKFGSRK